MTIRFFRAAALGVTLGLSALLHTSPAMATILDFEFTGDVVGDLSWDTDSFGLFGSHVVSFNLTIDGNTYSGSPVSAIFGITSATNPGDIFVDYQDFSFFRFAFEQEIDDTTTALTGQVSAAPDVNSPTFESRAWSASLAQAVPAPPVAAMLAAGLFGVGFARKQRAA